MSAPLEVEATVAAGPLAGRRMVVTVHRDHYGVLLTAKVQIEDRMVPIDIAAQVLAHTQEAKP
jgi:hypothetical protein